MINKKKHFHEMQMLDMETDPGLESVLLLVPPWTS